MAHSPPPFPPQPYDWESGSPACERCPMVRHKGERGQGEGPKRGGGLAEESSESIERRIQAGWIEETTREMRVTK